MTPTTITVRVAGKEVVLHRKHCDAHYHGFDSRGNYFALYNAASYAADISNEADTVHVHGRTSRTWHPTPQDAIDSAIAAAVEFSRVLTEVTDDQQPATVDGWGVDGLCAEMNGVFWIEVEIERYRDSEDTLVIHSCDGDPHEAPVPVIIALLRNAGYTVTPPTPDCCGRGCGECKEEA